MIPQDSLPSPDTTPAPDTGPCGCKVGQIWLNHSCVPSNQYGCGYSCSAKDPSACVKGSHCVQAGTATCTSAEPRTACVPKEPLPGHNLLRITPTSGVAGKAVTLMIEGANLYAGALMWNIRLSGGKPVFVPFSGIKCQRKVTVTPPKPGLYAVEVGYGVPPPKDDWYLAGFFLASGGIPPTPSAQPGQACTTKKPCAQASPYSCACTNGRCVCKK